VPAPPELRELLELLFERIEARTGYGLTSGRSATLEIVRNDSGFTLYAKTKFLGRDLFQPE
jgi:hypothetical protein